ncbi:hypothetical protein [Flavobacterium sp. 25HG05S-40]|uniref:hypothetical protein n=1 Tax=Flavobacterium sp. 25HG05S-40 TaxID=3458682 RepID=UPI0040441BCF
MARFIFLSRKVLKGKFYIFTTNYKRVATLSSGGTLAVSLFQVCVEKNYLKRKTNSEEMFEKLKEINRNRNTELTAKILIVLTIFHLLSVFCIYYKTKMNLTNPLIPKYLVYGIFEPYIPKGFILTIGLLIATILKFVKQNLIVIVVCAIVIVAYHLTSFKADF